MKNSERLANIALAGLTLAPLVVKSNIVTCNQLWRLSLRGPKLLLQFLGPSSVLGIFVALALQFDVSRGKESQYFNSAFLGYTVGLVLTIIVMNWFQAVQGIVGFLAVHVIWNGDIKPLLEIDESKSSHSQDADDKSSNK